MHAPDHDTGSPRGAAAPAPQLDPAAAAAGASQVVFALLSHPVVQLVRFVSKFALPWFITEAEFGEAALAGVLVFGLQHVAVFGLDEALVSAERLDLSLYRRLRRYQRLLTLTLATLLAAVGCALLFWPAERLLGQLLIAQAPMLFLANGATLPTALLVRERQFQKVFLVDLASIAAFTAIAVPFAMLGGGAWSLVAGWFGNAIAANLLARTFARAHTPLEQLEAAERAESFEAARARGGGFAGAAVLGYVGERIDVPAIGFAVGRAPLGLYEFALNWSQVMVNYASSLSERFVFPTLAAHQRAGGLGWGYMKVMRALVVFLLPAHILLASLSQPIVTTFFPERWHAAAPLLAVLALAAAARTFDVVAVTALKAAGDGRAVLQLGLLRLVLLSVALALALPHGVVATAAGVAVSRAIAAAVAVGMSARRLDLSAARREVPLSSALVACAAWCVAFGLALHWLGPMLSGLPLLQLLALPGGALGLWLLARALLDTRELREEWLGVALRLRRGGARA